MPDVLSINPLYQTFVTEGAAIFTCGQDYFVLEDPAVAEIVAALPLYGDTVGPFIASLQQRFPDCDVRDVLDRLVQAGVLFEAARGIPSHISALAAVLHVAPGRAAEALAHTPVRMMSTGPDQRPLLHALIEYGVSVSNEAALTVVLVDDYLDAALPEMNRQALETGRPWMLIQPGGAPLVGPIFIPGRTACWACLAARLRLNRPARRVAAFARPAAHSSLSSVVLPQSIVFAVAAFEIVRWIVFGGNDLLEEHLISVNMLDRLQTTHPVVRLARCPACGTPAPRSHPTRIHLSAQTAHATRHNGYRVLDAEAVFQQYRHLEDPITGVLQNLRPLEMTPSGPVHLFAVDHILMETPGSLSALRACAGTGSSGKGLTPEQARNSAFFEGIERLSAVYRGDEFVRLGIARSLDGAYLHPDVLAGWSAAQRADAGSKPAVSPALQVPPPFDEDKVIRWVPAWSLAEDQCKYVPAQYVYFGYPDDEPLFCFADSNGNAAGTTYEEAVLQGFLELCERDSVGVWYYNRCPRPAVCLASFDDPRLLVLTRHYEQTYNRDVWVLDLTTDLQIPVFVALSRRLGDGPEQIVFGFGAHFDPAVAAMRALTEMNQVLFSAQAASDPSAAGAALLDPVMRAWLQEATVASEPYLLPAPHLPKRSAADFSPVPSCDLKALVELGVARARSCGLDVFVVDLTRPDMGVPVVKVMAPGMAHHWRRLGHDRLYTVPVRLGWLAAPTPENKMNRWSLVV